MRGRGYVKVRFSFFPFEFRVAGASAVWVRLRSTALPSFSLSFLFPFVCLSSHFFFRFLCALCASLHILSHSSLPSFPPLSRALRRSLVVAHATQHPPTMGEGSSGGVEAAKVATKKTCTRRDRDKDTSNPFSLFSLFSFVCVCVRVVGVGVCTIMRVRRGPFLSLPSLSTFFPLFLLSFFSF